MAKEKMLTVEEKMEKVLVPEEEQLYVVPANWCWVRFGSLAIEMADGPFGSNLKTENYTTEKEARIIQLSNIGEDGWREENTKYTTFEHAKTIARSIVQPGNLVIAKMMPAGRAIICPSGEAMYILSSDAVKVVPYSELINRFLCYGINSYNFRLLVQENTQGITRARTSIKKLKLYPFPLPPLAEQHRIVERIGTIFAKLDKAKEKAQAVIDGYEDRKAAILHKAFTGELTKVWRKEHGLDLSSWIPKTSDELFEYVTSGSRGWAQYYSDDGSVFIRMGNLDHGTIELDMSDVQYVSLPDKAEGQRSLVQNGDILISITADVGMIGLVRNVDFEGYINQHIALARPTDKESAEFIAWYLVSDVGFAQLRRKQRGATKVGLGLNDIRTLTLNLPQREEQLRILEIVTDLLAKEAVVKETAETTIATISTMKQSILARAFRGELGTNDPSDEPAEELLKRILMNESAS